MKYIYREEEYDEGEGEYDAGDFNHTFVQQDGTPFMLVDSTVYDDVLDKIKALVATLEYEHG